MVLCFYKQRYENYLKEITIILSLIKYYSSKSEKKMFASINYKYIAIFTFQVQNFFCEINLLNPAEGWKQLSQEIN